MQTPLTTCLQTGPGGMGLTVGLNELFGPGPMAFSVGDGDAELELGAGVEVVDGASFSFVELHALNVLMATRAAPPAAIAIRRRKRSLLMMCPVCRGRGPLDSDRGWKLP